jgi:hypothetical protein
MVKRGAHKTSAATETSSSTRLIGAVFELLTRDFRELHQMLVMNWSDRNK